MPDFIRIAEGKDEAGVSESWNLQEGQRAAFEAMRGGGTFPEAARAAGVSRATVYRWVQHDPHFRAAYNAWRRELVESASARLLKLADKAVDVVDNALNRREEGIAVRVLKGLGVLRPAARGASTDPEVLKLRMQLREQQEQYRATQGLMQHFLARQGLSPAEQRQFLRAQLKNRTKNARLASTALLPAAETAPEAPDETHPETREAVSHQMDMNKYI